MTREAYEGRQVLADIKARRGEAEKFTLEVPDITTQEQRQETLVKHPADGEGLRALMASTPLRIGVGREGSRPATRAYFQMRADHAVTQDSLLYTVPDEVLEKMGVLNVGETQVHGDLETYLRRPDLGRRFSAEAKSIILAKCRQKPTVQFILSNGLGGYSIERYAGDVLKVMMDGLKAEGIDVGTPIYVNRGRVGLLNDIGEILDAVVSVILIGERPGLTISDALSIYMGYRQRWQPLTTDANRDNICMISRLGMDALEAGAEGVALIKDYLRYKTSGVALAERKRKSVVGQ